MNIKSKVRAWALSRRRPVTNGRQGDERAVYFWRYRILKTRLVSVFLHQFERSDEDRCLHDHPWPFVSIILRGGYWEQSLDHPAGRFKRPGSVLFRRASWAHRVTLEPSRPKPWSLVIVGPKVREWGFHSLVGWVPWKEGDPSPICETDDPRLDDPATFDRITGSGFFEVRPGDLKAGGPELW